MVARCGLRKNGSKGSKLRLYGAGGVESRQNADAAVYRQFPVLREVRVVPGAEAAYLGAQWDGKVVADGCAALYGGVRAGRVGGSVVQAEPTNAMAGSARANFRGRGSASGRQLSLQTSHQALGRTGAAEGAV